LQVINPKLSDAVRTSREGEREWRTYGGRVWRGDYDTYNVEIVTEIA